MAAVDKDPERFRRLEMAPGRLMHRAARGRQAVEPRAVSFFGIAKKDDGQNHCHTRGDDGQNAEERRQGFRDEALGYSGNGGAEHEREGQRFAHDKKQELPAPATTKHLRDGFDGKASGGDGRSRAVRAAGETVACRVGSGRVGNHVNVICVREFATGADLDVVSATEARNSPEIVDGVGLLRVACRLNIC